MWPLLAIMAVGTVISAIGKKKEGDAQKEAAYAEAQRDDYNAAVADVQAEDALGRGFDQESRFRAQVRGLIGSQRAAFAGGNVEVTSGSAADVQGDAAYLGELDAQTIHANAAREAWGYQQKAADLRMAADVARKGGKAAQTAGNYGAAGTLVSGAGSILLTKYGMDKAA